MAARFRVLDNGTLRDIKNLFGLQAGVSRRARTFKVMDDDELRTVAVFAPPMSASVSSDFASGRWDGAPGERVVTTFSVTASPVGGLAPYTYLWERTTGSGVANSPTSARTNFSASVPYGQALTGVFRCTITDAVGQQATVNVNAAFLNVGPGPI